MKTREEIYSVRFNRFVSDKDIFYTAYTIGVPIFGSNVVITPTKILLNKTTQRITITFDDNTSQDIGFTSEVQLFRRAVEQ